MNFLRRLALQEKQLDDSSRLDVVEIARVPDMLPSLFLSKIGLRNYQHPGSQLRTVYRRLQISPSVVLPLKNFFLHLISQKN